MCVGDQVFGFAVFGNPLFGAGRAPGEFPFVAEQHVEVAVVPSCRIGFPRAFNAAGGGVHTFAAAKRVDPAQPHGFDVGGFRFRANELGVTSAVGFAKRVAAGNKRNGFFVVHRHAGKGFAHIATGGDRIRIAIRTFRIHVDQAHLHCGERTLQMAISAVALVTKPLRFRAPIDVVFRFPDIFAATGKSEGFEAHGFQCAVAGEDHQIGPGQTFAVFLFDRPKQTSRLVEIAVVRPAVYRSKALVAGAGTATTIRNAIGAGAMPGHADEQAAVMSPVGGPPVL